MSAWTQQNPLQAASPLEIARNVLRRSDLKMKYWRGSWWQWYGGERWQHMSNEYMECLLWQELGDAWVAKEDGGARQLNPGMGTVKAVEACLKSVVLDPNEEWPHGTAGEGVGDPGRCVTMKDCVVEVTANGLVTHGKGWGWFDPCEVAATWREGAECPRWMRCLEEWGCGDPVWAEVAQRMFGYCLMGHRQYARWFLLTGKTRGGKGTMMRMLRRLLGNAYIGKGLEDLARQFGLWGLERCKVLGVGEVSEIKGTDAEIACRIIKNVVGGDPISLDRKGLEPLQNVVVRAVPVLQSNEVPRLPNKGRGLSAKMVVLPFRASWDEKEDVRLDETLAGEVDGVARWALEGAVKLELAKAGERWPRAAGVETVVESYVGENNPADAFLEDCFERVVGAVASMSVVQARYRLWCKENGVKPMPLPKVGQWVVEQSTWGLEKGRLGKDRMRVIRGIRATTGQEE